MNNAENFAQVSEKMFGILDGPLMIVMIAFSLVFVIHSMFLIVKRIEQGKPVGDAFVKLMVALSLSFAPMLLKGIMKDLESNLSDGLSKELVVESVVQSNGDNKETSGKEVREGSSSAAVRAPDGKKWKNSGAID